MAEWLQAGEGFVMLTLHIQPGAKKSGVAGMYGDALKIRLAAPPIDGRANQALIVFIAECLGVPRAAVQLVSGETSRRKRLSVQSPPQDVEARLLGKAAT